MKKVNFNNLDNIQIPETWTKNALSLPETLENKKKVAFFGKFSKNLALVASLVLVCALSVSLFIFTQKGDILNSQKPSQAIESTTVAQTQQPTQSESKISSVTETQEETQETESSASTEPTEETTEKTNAPTTPNTEKPTSSGDKETTSTENSDSSNPNGGSSNKPNGGQTPTQKPTPTVSETAPPEEPPDGPAVEFYDKITVEFPSSYLTGNGNVYCQIYDAYGTPLGDSDPYSDSHRALLKLSSSENTACSSYITSTYYIDKVGFSLSNGTYRYCFYNENGEPICNGLFDVY